LMMLLVQTNLVLPNTIAQTTPSAPEFTVKYADNSYYIPPTYGIDQYTGKNVTVKEGYTVNGKNLVFTIINQPFTPYNDSSGNNNGLYYNFRYKGHSGTQWSYYPFGLNERTVMSYNGQSWGSGDLSPEYPASSADKTVISIALQILDIRDAPDGSPIDCQVQAMEGHIDVEVTGLIAGDYYNFIGQSSGWSNTQTVTISNPLQISVMSPQAKNYSASDVPLNFTVNTPVSQIRYSLDGQENVTIAGNTILTDLSNGMHNVTVYVNDTYGNTGKSETISFTIAVPEPETEPFPTTLVMAASGASAIAIGVGLLVYFKKRRNELGNQEVKQVS
jgi:hypothetical protein